MGRKIVEFSLDHPRGVTAAMVIATLILAVFIPFARVDTDPENMLSANEPVRLFHNAMKKLYNLNDMIVLGLVNETDKDGMFNPSSLAKVHVLTQFALRQKGVVEKDLLAPGTIDDIRPAGPGTVRFSWLMKEPPKTRQEALLIKERAMDNPLLYGTLVSEDGKALCLYIPIESKDMSYRISKALEKKARELGGPERFFITGLPVAEDTFGVEMFIQMAVSAPLAMLVIFVLMWWFFRKLILIASPLIVALVSVVFTMGLLIGTGHTVHIMSSMIPIFIMPIAVLDSIHILSEFFDRYPKVKDRRKTSIQVMDELFVPMLYTSLTSAAGFASLALTPIPPVQVFGVFVAMGIMFAWVLTVTFIPAYTMLISEASLEGFGHRPQGEDGAGGDRLSRLLDGMGRFSVRRAWAITAVAMSAIVVAAYGISLIRINDNPVRWFEANHPIRIADRVLNEHFGGTYMAYLTLEARSVDKSAAEVASALKKGLAQLQLDYEDDAQVAGPILRRFGGLVDECIAKGMKAPGMMKVLKDTIDNGMASSTRGSIAADVWDDVKILIESASKATAPFKRPDMLRWIISLQKALEETGIVGKSSSLSDIVVKVHKELQGGEKSYARIPDSAAAVAQCLISYQGSHDPDDLWHLVTPDYRMAEIWVQLKSGDNKDMEAVKAAVDDFITRNHPPVPVVHRWFGLTYINVEWQNKMVTGMLQAFLGSFLIVFAMMVVLFRSPLWGLLSMIPLTITIALIYGVVGLVGKDYDMPVAVLSSLTLGLAVDFAIHFLSRSRTAVKKAGSWQAAAGPVFGEPARAITRNLIVIAVGFLPLLAAPLVPYKTVGVLLASILAVSGGATLFILPALITIFEKSLFSPELEKRSVTCGFGTLFWSGASLVLLAAISIHQAAGVAWSELFPWTIGGIVVITIGAFVVSRRSRCMKQEGSAGGAVSMVVLATMMGMSLLAGPAMAGGHGRHRAMSGAVDTLTGTVPAGTALSGDRVNAVREVAGERSPGTHADAGTPGASSSEIEGNVPSVDEIVRKANLASYYAGGDGKSNVEMIIKDSSGRTRRRSFTIMRKNVVEGGDQKFYVYFHRPSDVRRMVFMVWKHTDRDDDRWLYLPALDLVKRIAASDKRTSFVGSHFLYEDVSGRNPNADVHTLVDSSGDYYVLDNKPKNPGEVEFSSYRLWIDKKTFLPVKAVYTDKQGRQYRKIEALEVKRIQGIPTVVKARASDLLGGGYTENRFSKIRYGLGIPGKIFTKRYLRRAPRRWLRK